MNLLKWIYLLLTASLITGCMQARVVNSSSQSTATPEIIQLPERSTPTPLPTATPSALTTSAIARTVKTIVVANGLWIRDQQVVLDEDKYDNLFDFATSKNITDFYIDAFSLLRDEPTIVRQFINAASQHDFRVEFVVGSPEWANPENHFLPLSFLQDTIAFAGSLPTDQKLVGVQFDIRPYLLGEDWPVTAYLQLLEKLMIAAEGSNIVVTIIMPFWFDIDVLQQPFNGQERPLSNHIISIVDRTLILDYRDFATGTDGMIANMETEMAYAASLGKPVMIGLETLCNQLDPPKVTFCEEGEVVLNRELALVKAAYSEGASWGGTSIHNYTAYRELVSFPCPEDGSLSIAEPRDGYHTTNRFISVYGCGGVPGQSIQITVVLEDGPHLQDELAIPDTDGRWQIDRVILGGEPLPAEHYIYAMTVNEDGSELQSEPIIVTKETQ